MTETTTENSQQPDVFFQHAQQRSQSGDLSGAELSLDQCLALKPDHVPGLELAARLALAQDKLDRAEIFARRGLQLNPHALLLLTLAEVMQRKGLHDKAINYFKRVLDVLPQEQRALTGLLELYAAQGQTAGAVECCEKLLRLKPNDWQLALRYAHLLPGDKLPAGLEALEAARPPPDTDPDARLAFLSQLVPYKEWALRVQNNLPPYHITKIEDLGFHLARADFEEYENLANQLLARGVRSVNVVNAKSACLFAQGKLSEAEAIYGAIAAAGSPSIYYNAVFSDEFFDNVQGIDDSELTSALPEVRTVVSPTFHGEHVIYLGCNFKYFDQFAKAFLLSINERARDAQVHLHIMDVSEANLRRVLELAKRLDHLSLVVTVEQTGELFDKTGITPNQYYHSIRFIRFFNQVRAYNKTYWMMDVDALLNRDPAALFEKIRGHDVAFRARPGRLEPWNQMSACLFGVTPTDIGVDFLRLTAKFIFEFFKRRQLGWGIDQLAMYSAFQYLRRHDRMPKTFFLGNMATDLTNSPEGYFWLTAGREKFVQYESATNNVDMPESYANIKYYNALKGYLSRL